MNEQEPSPSSRSHQLLTAASPSNHETLPTDISHASLSTAREDSLHQIVEERKDGTDDAEAMTKEIDQVADYRGAAESTGREDEADAQTEEDPLVVAKREQEERERALALAADVKPSDDPALKAFYADMKEVDRENEVNRILGAFRLNPFEILGLRFDATDDQIRQQYRKVSLTVHPDKCSHPKARDAFEMIVSAEKELLDKDKRERLDFILNAAREEVRAEWRKAMRHDAATRIATILHDGDREKAHAVREKTDEFHEAWKNKSRDLLARAEWRRRKLGKRLKNEEERAKQDFEAEKAENKRKREEIKAWEESRESRIGSWRDFASGKGKKKKSRIGGTKPPKAKAADAEKTYVQRPIMRS